VIRSKAVTVLYSVAVVVWALSSVMTILGYMVPTASSQAATYGLLSILSAMILIEGHK